MHYLIFDTCVWINIVQEEYSLVAKITKLVEDGMATIVVPDLVREEWNRKKTEARKQITKKLAAGRREILRVLEDATNVRDVDPDAHAGRRIASIDSIIESATAISVSSDNRDLAVNFALDKKPPFRYRNSMADALIFFSMVDWFKTIEGGKFIFVSKDGDFSDKGDKTRLKLADELMDLVEEQENFEYLLSPAQALNRVRESTVTDEEIELSAAIVARDSALEDYRETVVRTGYAQGAVDQLARNPLEELRKQQERLDQLVRNPLEEFRKQQETIDRLTRDPFKELKEQQEMMDRVTRDPFKEMKEQQEMMDRMTRDPLKDLPWNKT